jgi:hypothetical protein
LTGRPRSEGEIEVVPDLVRRADVDYADRGQSACMTSRRPGHVLAELADTPLGTGNNIRRARRLTIETAPPVRQEKILCVGVAI